MALTNSELVNLLHMLFVGPLLIYIGVMGDKSAKPVLYLTGILGLFVVAYHTYLFITKMKNN